jgi:hypothetical protein
MNIGCIEEDLNDTNQTDAWFLTEASAALLRTPRRGEGILITGIPPVPYPFVQLCSGS